MLNPESIIKDQVRAIFIGTPVVVWNHPTGYAKLERVTYGLVGSSDLIGLLPGGRFLAIEVKTATGTQSKEQRNFQQMIERLGGLYILARSGAEARAAIEAAGFKLWPSAA